MKILGLDPGLGTTGWGLIQAEGNRLSHIANGELTTKTSAELPQRLASLAQQLEVVAGQLDLGSGDLGVEVGPGVAAKLQHERGEDDVGAVPGDAHGGRADDHVEGGLLAGRRGEDVGAEIRLDAPARRGVEAEHDAVEAGELLVDGEEEAVLDLAAGHHGAGRRAELGHGEEGEGALL